MHRIERDQDKESAGDCRYPLLMGLSVAETTRVEPVDGVAWTWTASIHGSITGTHAFHGGDEVGQDRN